MGKEHYYWDQIFILWVLRGRSEELNEWATGKQALSKNIGKRVKIASIFQKLIMS